MKRFVIFLSVLVFNSSLIAKISEETEYACGNGLDEILEPIRNWMKAYTERNPELALATFSQSKTVLLVGTGADEFREGHQGLKNEIQRDLAQSQNLEFQLSNFRFSCLGQVAWGYLDIAVHPTIEGQDFAYPSVRASYTLVKESGAWKAHMAHFSVPDAHQEVGHSFRMADSLAVYSCPK